MTASGSDATNKFESPAVHNSVDGKADRLVQAGQIVGGVHLGCGQSDVVGQLILTMHREVVESKNAAIADKERLVIKSETESQLHVRRLAELEQQMSSVLGTLAHARTSVLGFSHATEHAPWVVVAWNRSTPQKTIASHHYTWRKIQGDYVFVVQMHVWVAHIWHRVVAVGLKEHNHERLLIAPEEILTGIAKSFQILWAIISHCEQYQNDPDYSILY